MFLQGFPELHYSENAKEKRKFGSKKTFPLQSASKSFFISFNLALASFLVSRGNFPPTVT